MFFTICNTIELAKKLKKWSDENIGVDCFLENTTLIWDDLTHSECELIEAHKLTL